jgi:hypothetical protein
MSSASFSFWPLYLRSRNRLQLLDRTGLTINHPVGSLQAEAKNHHGILITYDRLPLAFDANQGQTDARVKFLSHSGGRSLFLTQDEAVLVLPTGKRDRRQWRGLSLPANSTNATNGGHRCQSPVGANEAADSIGGSVLRMKLYDANPAAKVRGVEELPGKANSFIGNDLRSRRQQLGKQDPSRWQSQFHNPRAAHRSGRYYCKL